MIIENMRSAKGNFTPNQFIIREEGRGSNGNFIEKLTFQSYDSVIATRIIWEDEEEIELDKDYWDYSRTTSKFRNLFLGESTKETKKKIKEGQYKLVNLNN